MFPGLLPLGPACGSPPSRGAWIEICALYESDRTKEVAPLAGGVD